MYVRLVIKCTLFVVALIAIAGALAFLSNILPQRYTYPPGSTSSTLLVLGEDEQYDLLFMGASHAYFFMDQGNHSLISTQLDKKVASIAHGSGAGIVPMSIMTDYFFAKGNTCKKAIYLIDSQSFFSRWFNEEQGFLQSEPMDFLLFRLAIKHHMENNALGGYFQSKLRPDWWQTKPVPLAPITDSITKIDPVAVKRRIENMFPDSLNTSIAAHYKEKMDALVGVLKQHHCEVLFVVPPSLLGKLPGDDYLLALLDGYKQKDGIEYLDLSSSITDPTMYVDHDHLNSKGVRHLLTKYLQPHIEKR